MARQGYDNTGQKSYSSQSYRNTYNSISGVDIKAVLGGITFGNLQAISYSVTREKVPIYTMGSPECRGYSRGKRGIAGSMVFVMFDSHALLDAFRYLAENNDKKFKFVSDKDEIRPAIESEGTGVKVGRNGSGTISTGAVNTNRELALSGPLSNGWKREIPWYADQIPAFNIVLTGVNEEGFAAVMAILGAEILNEGYGVSIDDLLSEHQITYVARSVAPWQRIVDRTLRAEQTVTNIPTQQVNQQGNGVVTLPQHPFGP